MPFPTHHLSDQIREIIRASGWSQVALCQHTGISQPTMSRFLDGRIGLSMAKLDRLAELLDLTIAVGPNAAPVCPDRRRKEHKGK